MPLQSKAQERWVHTAEGTKALGGPAKVEEWEKETDHRDIPERKKPGPKPKPTKRLRHTTRPR